MASRLFTSDAWMQLPDLAARYPTVSPFGKHKADMDVSDAHLMIIMPGEPPEAFYLRAATTGVVRSSWIQQNGDARALDTMIGSALRMHKSLTVERFGFNGRVLLALRNGWRRTLQGDAFRRHLISVTYPDFVLADELDDPNLRERLKRHVSRSRGTWDPEP